MIFNPPAHPPALPPHFYSHLPVPDCTFAPGYVNAIIYSLIPALILLAIVIVRAGVLLTKKQGSDLRSVKWGFYRFVLYWGCFWFYWTILLYIFAPVGQCLMSQDIKAVYIFSAVINALLILFSGLILKHRPAEMDYEAATQRTFSTKRRIQSPGLILSVMLAYITLCTGFNTLMAHSMNFFDKVSFPADPIDFQLLASYIQLPGLVVTTLFIVQFLILRDKIQSFCLVSLVATVGMLVHLIVIPLGTMWPFSETGFRSSFIHEGIVQYALPYNSPDPMMALTIFIADCLLCLGIMILWTHFDKRRKLI